MIEKTKIGILTFFDTKNFGAALQAFALQQNISRMGAESEFLNYVRWRPDSLPKKNNKIASIFKSNPQLLWNMLFHIKRTLLVKKKTKPNSIGFEKFRNQYLRCSREKYYVNEDFLSANHLYNGFIAGSDMVWTPIKQNFYPYFLRFADKGKRFSYAPSLTGCDRYSQHDNELIKTYLQDIDFLSCREQEGVEYVKKVTGRDAVLTIDPTLLFNKKDWQCELDLNSTKPNKKYILCYTFGGLPKKIKKEVYRIAKERNMVVRYVPMNHEESYSELKNGSFGPYGPREFVELFLNASFVVTNTYHGFLFSLISENPFVVLHRERGSAWRANETRISNLMELIGVANRYINPDDTIDEKFLDLDYSKINPIISEKRESSLCYLRTVVDAASKNRIREKRCLLINVGTIPVKSCTGCALCSHVCPFGAIEMKENDEGFIVPVVNENKCKECGKCVKKCPSIYPQPKHEPIETKLCLSKDGLIERSASGGLFITLARYYIENLQGVVYGAVFDKDFNCKHAEATTLEELMPMQNSKYVQSEIGDCYRKAAQRIKEGRKVLFTGTPCQIAALKSYLNRDYENLLTLEVVCHGVPNQRFWKKYLEQYIHEGNIKEYLFRNRGNKRTQDPSVKTKRRGTQECTVITNSGVVHIPARRDPFYGTFVRNESFRMSCYYCSYACPKRTADITMGDCDSDKNYPYFFPYESKSIAIVNTLRGQEMWRKVESCFESVELDYELERKANVTLSQPCSMPIARDFIYKDLNNLSWAEFSKKYSFEVSKIKDFIIGIMKR